MTPNILKGLDLRRKECENLYSLLTAIMVQNKNNKLETQEMSSARAGRFITLFVELIDLLETENIRLKND